MPIIKAARRGKPWCWGVDGILVHSQEKGENNFKVKLGIMYSRKELENEMAKYKRYWLIEKRLYGGIEEPGEFGEKLYLMGEEKLACVLCEDEDKRQKIANLVTYIENNRNSLYGSRSSR